jgi:hypothetical protein
MLNYFTVTNEADFLNPVTWWSSVGNGKVVVLVWRCNFMTFRRLTYAFRGLSVHNGQ